MPTTLTQRLWKKISQQLFQPKRRPAVRHARLGIELLEQRELLDASSHLARTALGGPAVLSGPATPVFQLAPDLAETGSNGTATSFTFARLEGQTSPGARVTMKGKSAIADSSGRFVVHDVALALGANKLTATATLNGLQRTFTTSVERIAVPAGTTVLKEEGRFLSETTFEVGLGASEGTRTLSFDLQASLDRTDRAASGDTVHVSLVNSSDPNQTLLASRGPGTPLFLLTETGSEFLPGLVRYDGRTIQIDVTGVVGHAAGTLLVQLVSADVDSNSEIHLGAFGDTLDVEGVVGPVVPFGSSAAINPGPAISLTGMTTLGGVRMLVQNVQFSDAANQWQAELVLQNNGSAAVSQNLAVLLPGLPANVQIAGASGVNSKGVPYINFGDAIASGGLSRGDTSAPVRIRVNDPDRVRFALRPTVIGSANKAPVLPAVSARTIPVGGHVEINLGATDANGDEITYSIRGGTLPTGMLLPDGTLILTPAPEDVGVYKFTIVASDGVLETTRPCTITVVEDANTHTRVSGQVLDIDGTPIPGMIVEVGAVQGLTGDDGRFLLDLGPGIPASLTIKVRGELYLDANYPFIAEKIEFMLGHVIYAGANNVIGRPIFLPTLNDGQTVNPGLNQTVTSTDPNLQGASVFIQAGTLLNSSGQQFTGELSITEVPTDLTPAALPDNLLPDLVVTIQPGEMLFAVPAGLTLPNRAGYAPGTIMNLWSINPSTGEFDLVGQGQVSADGTVIVTISGGVRNSSWHFFAPPPPSPDNPEDNDNNKEPNTCPPSATANASSTVQLHTGALNEAHALVPYQSLGMTRGITLTYDSMRADPRPVLHFGYSNVVVNANQRLVAKVIERRGDFEYTLPGFEGGMGLTGGEHFWKLDRAGQVQAALQLDFREFASGSYEYDLITGLLQFNGTNFAGTTATRTGTMHVVNMRGSVFGNGWGITGLTRLVENPDGSLLFINEGGGELLFGAPAAAGQPFDSPAGDFSTLVKLVDGTFTRTFTDQSIDRYDNKGRIVSSTDRNGNVTQYQYNAFGISRIIDPVGLATVFTYTGSKVTSIVDPAGRATLLTYDAKGNLASVTDPDGAKRAWTYDADFHMTGETDALGNKEQEVYNFAGQVIEVTTKDGRTLQFRPAQSLDLYDAALTSHPDTAPSLFGATAAPVATYTDANGNVVETTLDAKGRLIAARDTRGNLSNVNICDCGLIRSVTDARGNITRYDYDDRGNVIGIADSVSTTGRNLVIDLIEGSDDPTVLLVDAVIAPGSGIDVVPGSAAFVGRIGDGVTGNTAQSGVYSGFRLIPSNTTLPGIANPDGIYLTSGTANIPRTNTASAFGVSIGSPGDANLSALVNGGTVRDANSLTFQFTVPAGKTSIEADLVFGSDEFPDQSVTDIFGFFVDGVNYAVFPDGSLMSFVQGANAANFNDNNVGTGNYRIEYDGISNSLHVIGLLDANIPAGQPHTIKIAIGDTSDTIFDSGVFIGNLVLGTATAASSGIRPAAAQRTFQYDPTFSQLTEAVNELGQVTRNEIDPANGNTLKSTRIVGLVDAIANGETDDIATAYTYTPRGLIDTVTDPLGRITDYDYDARGRVVKVTFAKGTTDEATRLFTYDAAGNQTSVTDENGHKTVFVYDAMNRLVKTVEADPDGAGALTSPVTQYAYDRNGNLVKSTDARGNVATNTFDELDRLVKTASDPDGAGPRAPSVVTYTHDAEGNVLSMTDALGQTTHYEYDARNRRIASIDPDGGVTRFEYDLDGNVTKVIDPVGNTTLFAYDARNRLLTETDPLGKVITYDYDGNNNLRVKTDREGRKTEYDYDALNRMVKESWLVTGQPAANIINYAYDKAGNLLSISDAFSALAMTYDSRNRVLTVSNAGTPGAPVVNLTYLYDDVGNVLKVADTIDGNAGAETAYVYDNLDRLKRLTQSGADTSEKRVDFGYNNLGQYTQINRFANLAGTQLVASTLYGYDGMNRLTSLVHKKGANVIDSYAYTYDADSRITRIVSKLDGQVDYSYDDRDQLTGADYGNAGTADETYQYDANGNRVQSHLHANGYVTGPGNRLLSDGTFNYEYDDEGNMTKRTSIADGSYREFAWDHRNRLMSVTDKSSGGVITNEVTFTYDAMNRRIAKTANGASLLFVYDREDVLLDFADADAGGPGAPGLAARFLHGEGIDQVLTEDHGVGDSRWLLADHLMTTRTVIGNSGNLMTHLSFDAYGNLLAQTNPSVEVHHVLSGREFDPETGFYYYRQRYYDAGIGRFLTEDPIRYSSGDTNLFASFANSPQLHVDPYGLDSSSGSGSDSSSSSSSSSGTKWECFLNINSGACKGDVGWTYIHCIRSCQGASFLPDNFVKECGKKIEDYQKFICELTGNPGACWSADQKQDHDANEAGVGCGSSSSSCEKCCEEKLGSKNPKEVPGPYWPKANPKPKPK